MNMNSAFVVPVIDVQNDNFRELWPAMVVAIKTSAFIALDTELSGLGNRKSLLAESIEDRYKAICHAARSRSILSLGIACYKKLDNKAADTYLVQVYNLTLLCSEEYIIEPQSVNFLVQHGFDFNKQYAHGIPYCKGNNKGESDSQGVHIRALFTELLRARKPLALHNGLIDMAFLYQCFYAHLPERLATFTADLSEMFPAGIYDTKYVTEFELRLTASYLEYAYKKCKLDNSRSVTSGGTGPHVHLEFCQYAGRMSTYVDFRACPAVALPEGQTDICERFSAFGWCPNGTKCPLSHDTDLIILNDDRNKVDKKKKRKRRREKKKGGKMAECSSDFDGAPENKVPHMEVEPDEVQDGQEGATAELSEESRPPLVTEQATAGHASDVCLMDTDRNGQPTEEGDGMKSDSKGKGVGEDSTEFTNATTGNNTVNMETNNGHEESKTAGEREELSGHSTRTGEKNKQEAGTHRAGFDAFMTGYIFAYSCSLDKKGEVGDTVQKKKKEEEEGEAWLPICLNKLYLSGKAAPLHIVKSTFSKSSKAHLQKMEMVWGRDYNMHT
ncbi:target of EGR1 protein 1 [Thalassophryne amazonica]|uniref:target of EGR1 protein 1 n=1 Tax=Thalassophryne amazonica TaxID=390379 RepID=UPI00147223F9|nr:target of EGR1 protein 1 [Thalassophryne amazonica]